MASVQLFLVLSILILQYTMNVSGLNCSSCVLANGKGDCGNSTIGFCNSQEDADASLAALGKAAGALRRQMATMARSGGVASTRFQCYEVVDKYAAGGRIYLRGCTGDSQTRLLNLYCSKPDNKKAKFYFCSNVTEVGEACNMKGGSGSGGALGCPKYAANQSPAHLNTIPIPILVGAAFYSTRALTICT